MTLTTTDLRAAADRLIAAAAAPLQSDPVRDILIEVGRRGLVSEQEDMINDVALDLLNAARSPQNLPFGGRAANRDGVTVGAALKTGL